MPESRHPMLRPVQSVSVFGLGKLGASMVGCFASAGMRTIGVDINPASVRAVNRGRAPVEEPGLQSLFTRYRRRISATRDAAAAVGTTDASFIIVPTPSRPDGSFNSRFVEQAVRTIGQALRNHRSYHLVVVTSTVLPGTMKQRILPVLERASGRLAGRDFGLCYSPEFIAIGNVIRGLLHPDFFLIGEHDSRAGSRLESIYRIQGGPRTPIVRMSMVNAELTKISVNTYVTGKIAFANQLARICDRLPGGDAFTVAQAVGLDHRIGPACLKPGPSFGGPCFPRDNRAFAAVARKRGLRAPAAEATIESNRAHTRFLQHYVEALKPAPSARLAVLGLSYRPGTGLLEESCAVELAHAWSVSGPVSVHDPLADPGEIRRRLPGCSRARTVPACIRNADIIVYATDHEAYRPIDLKHVARLAPGAILVDVWGRWASATTPDGLSYRTPGFQTENKHHPITSRGWKGPT